MKLAFVLFALVFAAAFINIQAVPFGEDAFSFSETSGNASASGNASVIPSSTKIPKLQVTSSASSKDNGKAAQVDFADYSKGYPSPSFMYTSTFSPYSQFPSYPSYPSYPSFSNGDPSFNGFDNNAEFGGSEIFF
ncbi:hypothetical protein Gasu2_55310 [Galdieria sulphuraria]|uniref:Uncharacterized protein n=1 Tax=Galdieria sulphuraria TaxID=130081 RepID=M2WYU9_GALSU|nr:uncharacterized protein Gasu_34310 [Galdieria sulphuraria]EME29235.1 hypothetical protein Gasu_34310 [Galdieria sulphuraria]GJD11391.1 hypothetical protein Gasu2_55310 [Galdieria sulphuraria]|eukprot:XP_005705755.1 hypothetical protein Gasu_34310 [Galdieria sulphuraria]